MNWAFELADEAKRKFKRLPRNIQQQIANTLESMKSDPFQGDVVALHGSEWKGVFRRRVGSYRLLFALNHSTKTITVLAILPRSEKTYR